MRYVPLYFLMFFSCNETYLPKQKAYFAPSFENKEFTLYTDNCKNEFLINSLSKVNEVSNCSYEIIYENYKAKIFINSVESDLKDINIQEFFNEKLFENSKFADRVMESMYDSNDKNISSKVYTFIGDTPSNIQFYITNNKNKFFTGSLYFNSKPNYDSLLPYIDYIGDDIKKMVDSFTWIDE
jgi:gliding motility-associated lipoprotein GldD